MPGYTSHLAIPYATDSDSARDAISVIPQQAAEKVDDLISAIPGVNPAPWAVLTDLGGGWGSGTTYTRRAGMASVNFATTKASWIAGEIVGRLPAGYRPTLLTHSHYLWVAALNTATPVSIYIDPDGFIRTTVAGSGGGLLGEVTFPC